MAEKALPNGLAAYPTQVGSSLSVLIAKIKNSDTVTNQEACQAAWHLLGFALQIGYPDGPVAMFSIDRFSEADLCERLEDAQKKLADKSMKADAATAIPWATLIPMLLQFLQLFLQKT